MRSRYFILILAILLIGTGITGVSLADSGKIWREHPNKAPLLANVPDFSSLAEQTIPGVVSISVVQKSRVSSRYPGDPSEFFHRFFGQPLPPNRPQPRSRERVNRGIGSGFAIHEVGLILTNYHVIEGADLIEVTFPSPSGHERVLEAEILGTAKEYDVALLKTKEKAHCPSIFLGDSASMKIGEWVMAIGNPFGLSHSVSVGIISAKDRRDINPSGRHGLYNFLQTDASINPGNSGGPLINIAGEVIGINTAINAAGSGIGFAIPINMVKEMLPQLKTKGSYSRSWIGIRIQPMSPELAETYGMKSPKGALVAEVVPDGPGARAGLHDGDIILEFNGKKIRNHSELQILASMAGIGSKSSLLVLRNGKTKSLKLKMQAFPEEEKALAQKTSPENWEQNELGITLSHITQKLRKRLDIQVKSGALIKLVQPGSLASRAGLRSGDVIMKLNGKKIKGPDEFLKKFKKHKSGKILRLQIARGDSRLYLALRRPE